MDKIKVICAFTGLGKTTLGKKYKNICDLQMSKYKFDYSNIKEEDYEKMKGEKTRKLNLNWPNNYLSDIKSAINKYDLVLLPANIDIRELLVKNNIDFILILPSFDSRDNLLKTFKERGNSEDFINTILKRFDTWSRNQKDYDYPIITLNKGKNLEEFLLEQEYIKK